MQLRSFLAALLLAAIMVARPGTAASFATLPADASKATGQARVVSVTDGDTLVLDNGVTVRLVGLQAPKLPLDRPNFKEWPLAGEARRALEDLVLHQRLTLHPATTPTDRWQRMLAHLSRDDGLWVQGEMLRQGWARMYTFPDNRMLASSMRLLEREARAARRGIWRHPYYAVLTPEGAAKALNTFQLVEGKIVDAAEVKGRAYLNFGEDWKTDFTIMVPAKVKRALARQGDDPVSLEGRTVRVRGWLKSYNGPMVELTHPEQLEVLDGGSAPRR